MGIGAYMFVAHRLAAVGLTVYLYVHLVTLGRVLTGPEGFDRAMALMNTPAIRLLELALVWVVLFHMLNGIRVSLLAMFPWLNQKWLSYAVISVSVAIAVLSLPFFL